MKWRQMESNDTDIDWRTTYQNESGDMYVNGRVTIEQTMRSMKKQNIRSNPTKQKWKNNLRMNHNEQSVRM
jgi:hypothetical protein